MKFRALAAAFAMVLAASGCGPAPDGEPAEGGAAALRIGVMPKLVGIDYFNASQTGAEEAAAELGIDLDYDGPTTNSVNDQIRMIETWIAKGYDAIAVAPNDPDAIAPVLRRAREAGIAVLTWDADAQTDARDFFVNQCTSESVARTLMDVMAENVGEDAKYLILTGSLTAANQNIWMAEMETYRQERYPNMVNLSETPKASEEDQALATQVTVDVLKSYPDLQGIFAITSVALPGAAEGLRKAQAADKVFLTGLSTPGSMKDYVADGTCKEFVLWSPVDLGYLTVHAAVAAAKDGLAEGAATFDAGRLGAVAVNGSELVLGPPIRFTAENIGDYAF